ncbi:hypothetical protein FRB98_009535 [Tulasnella sp. 332]|nr:hypothetical protein FRB98_009535 [Tulasnella sp. 332]
MLRFISEFVMTDDKLLIPPVNTDALTGYEIVSTLNQDFNYVPDRWYYKFTPRPKNGSHCDPYKFTIGDSFFTTQGILTYQLAAMFVSGTQPSVGSSIPYKGTPLGSCDVSYMSAIVDARLLTSTIVAGIGCTDEPDFPVIFTTSFDAAAYIDGESSSFGTILNKQLGNLRAFNDLSLNVSYILDDAGDDLYDLVNDIYTSAPTTNPALISISTQSDSLGYPAWWCSANSSAINPTCMTAAPHIALDPSNDMTLLDVNGKPVPSNGIEANYTAAISNAMQVMLAAVRLDLGNVLPNNILVNRSSELIDEVITKTFAASGDDSDLYADLASSEIVQPVYLPEGVNPTRIALEYQCRMEQKRSPGEILVSVSVATLTFFKGGWAVFLLVLTFLAKRYAPEDECTTCSGHGDLEARIRAEVERQLASSSSTPHLEKLEKEA